MLFSSLECTGVLSHVINIIKKIESYNFILFKDLFVLYHYIIDVVRHFLHLYIIEGYSEFWAFKIEAIGLIRKYYIMNDLVVN
jgi:hypothetical protein